MANPRGLSFQLGGTKRAGGSAAVGPKKPVSVKDLFSGDSDDEQEDFEPKKPRISAPSGALTCASAVPPAPTEEVKKVADKLAEFVAKNGQSFEEVTRQRNPGDTPFKFLFDKNCSDYKYYQHKLNEFASKLGRSPTSNDAGGCAAPAGVASNASRHHSSCPIPSRTFQEAAPARHSSAAHDSVAAMNAYMQLAARKDKAKSRGDDEDEQTAPSAVALNETSFDRRKVVAVVKPDGARGHHMNDFIPPEEMAKFMAKCGDSTAAAQAAALEQKQAIGADNIGHKLLQKMGWKEGQGIGASGTGIAVPVKATGVKQDNLGIGAEAVGEVSSGDDIYEQYRKRMMLGYKFRPNPLGNPRKAYY